MIVTAGDGIVLRTPEAADAPRWLELARDPDQVAWGAPVFVSVPTTVTEVEERLRDHAAKGVAGEPSMFTVAAEAEQERFLGDIAWRWSGPPQLGVCDIGYAVHPDARGTGVGRRAIRLITRWLTEDPAGPGLARVQLDHSVENVASCRVALAAGFEREGVRRAFLPLPDETAPGRMRRHDVCLHGYVAG